MTPRDICLEIGKRYEVHFLEIGTDKDLSQWWGEKIAIVQNREKQKTIFFHLR